MTGPNHTDIQRDMGRMEGKQDAMGARLDRLEKIIEDGFAEVRREIAELKAEKAERKGALGMLGIMAGVVGGAISLVVEWFMKGHGG